MSSSMVKLLQICFALLETADLKEQKYQHRVVLQEMLPRYLCHVIVLLAGQAT